MAASDTTATGSTTLLMKIRLELRTSSMHSAATRTMASTVIRTCTFTCRREVTKRMTPTTLPFTVRG